MSLQPPQLLEAPSPLGEPTAPERPPASAGQITRRRSLPSGRALVGALLITVAALGAFLVASSRSGGPETSYAVAAQAVEAGGPLVAGDIRLEGAVLPDDVAAQAFSDPDDLAGAVALAPILPGQLIAHGDVLLAGDTSARPSPGQEYSFRLPRDHAVNGSLTSGDLVDVLATYGTGERTETWVVARDALVTAFDDGSDPALGDGDAVTVTLSVDDESTILRLVHASDSAVVTLVRATRGAALADGPERYAGPADR